jgi:general secretion pathway protein G
MRDVAAPQAPGVPCPPPSSAAALRARRARTGFTIIELIAVTAIIAVLTAMAIPQLSEAVERARVARAIGDIEAIETDLQSLDSLPPTLASIGRGDLLDPWGRPYVYYPFPPSHGHGHAPPQGARRDRFLVPVNSEYDLYSVGKDGNTAIPFTARASLDDVVRANDGGYVGLASKF